jgi:hypothetical protein
MKSKATVVFPPVPFHPQSKHVERFFATLHKRFNAKAYLDNGVDAYANDLWVSDHAIHDVEITNKDFAKTPKH